MMIIWVTGLSGSGKTTLCGALWRVLKPRLPGLVLLDGDSVRAAFGNDLGYREADRHRQIMRVQRLTRLLSEQQVPVIVAALYAHPSLLAWNRQHLRYYFEVYLEASLDAVRRRDPKGLYMRAASDEVHDVVGVDIRWHIPEAPDLTLNTDRPEPPEMMAQKVIRAIPSLMQVVEVV